MVFHSTNGKTRNISLPGAIENGLAADGGLFMPDTFPALPRAFFNNIAEMSLQEIGYVVSTTLFGEYLSAQQVKLLVDSALDFPVPLVEISRGGASHSGNADGGVSSDYSGDAGGGISAGESAGDSLPHDATAELVMELFHGPTLSFKDVGSRFMARLFPLLLPEKKNYMVLLATSGDSGGAIADAFRENPEAKVMVLFPRGELSHQQMTMFSGMSNVKAVEIGGTFDDCQQLVKQALLDKELNASVPLVSGNSINLARQFPSMIYYFHAYARAMEKYPDAAGVVVSVPCGNLGNLSAALMAKKMGLPVERFIGANNSNDTFVEYLQTGGLRPRRALVTLARAMDVGNPSNLARIIDLYGGNLEAMRRDIEGVAFSDREILQTIREVYESSGYLLGPQSATAYRALQGRLRPGEVGVAVATGHPANYPRAIREAIGRIVPLPDRADSPRRSGVPPTKIPPTLNALTRVIMQSM